MARSTGDGLCFLIRGWGGLGEFNSCRVASLRILSVSHGFGFCTGRSGFGGRHGLMALTEPFFL
jgi:hypothetical protein